MIEDNPVRFNSSEYKELKNIIMYALERNYGIHYIDAETTIKVIDMVFTKKESENIKREYIVS